jgi:hypothetical protein
MRLAITTKPSGQRVALPDEDGYVPEHLTALLTSVAEDGRDLGVVEVDIEALTDGVFAPRVTRMSFTVTEDGPPLTDLYPELTNAAARTLTFAMLAARSAPDNVPRADGTPWATVGIVRAEGIEVTGTIDVRPEGEQAKTRARRARLQHVADAYTRGGGRNGGAAMVMSELGVERSQAFRLIKRARAEGLLS